MPMPAKPNERQYRQMSVVLRSLTAVKAVRSASIPTAM